MSASLEDLVNDMISREGGYVNNAADKGGPTRYGITQKTLSDYLGRAASIDEVKNLDVDLAKEIIQANYYYGPRINTLPSEIQPELFDMCVNHGPRNGVKLLQHVINKAGWGPVDVDGAIGPATRQAAVKCYAAMQGYMINALADERQNLYRAIVRRDPSQEQFANGWKKRDDSFRVAV